MTSWQIVHMFAGTMILLSLALAAFVGANLMQTAFTRWCPLEIMLRKFGVQGGC